MKKNQSWVNKILKLNKDKEKTKKSSQDKMDEKTNHNI